MTILCASGHRPDKLGGFGDVVQGRLVTLAMDVLSDMRPQLMVTGMALGWDQAIAEACRILKVPYLAAVPFEGQERHWPAPSQLKYRFLREHAYEVKIISEGGYDVAKMHRRNEYMVNTSDGVLALWNGSPGGTCACLDYARLTGKPIYNVWDRWTGKR